MSEEEEQIELTIGDIVLMRIYDILMSKFMLENPKDGEKLYELHRRGGLLMPKVDYNPAEIITEENND